MKDPFDSFNTVSPMVQETTNVSEQIDKTETSLIGNNDSDNRQEESTVSQETITESETEKNTDTFFEIFNKRFNTQYKADDEIKSIFEVSKKIPEYESKLKDRDELAKSVEQYKKDLESLKQSESSKYLSDPLMQKAYVANQLQKKYPDKDPFILQEIAMSDVDKMGDLDAVAKERKIKYPSMPLENIKKVILSDLGIDATTAPEEWDSLAKDKLTMMAGDARENIKKLTQGIEMPKVESREEILKRESELLSKRAEEVKPYKEQYGKFEKFKIGEGLDYTVPKEFQEKLGDMFDAFVLKAGNDPTKENLQTLEELRDSFFFNAYKKEIYEVMRKDAETKIKAEWEAKLGNTQLPNTSTASDGAQGEQGTKPGHNDFKRDQQGSRVTHFG